MSLQLEIEELSPTLAVVTFAGTLTLGTSLKIADSQLQALFNKGITSLVLDLTRVPYSDSAGLGTLVHTYGLAQEHGGGVRLCGLSDRIASMLKMTRTDAFLPTDPDRATSIAALR